MRLSLFIFSLLLLNCSTARARNNPETPPLDVNYCPLSKDPSAFSGKRIRIRAIYRYMFEIQRLEPPACCPDRMDKTWVEIDAGLEGHSLRRFNKFPEGMGVVLVVFVGRFDTEGPYGDGGYRFKLTVDRIEALERTSRSSRRQDDPAWVPKNCDTSNAAPPEPNTATLLREAQHASPSESNRWSINDCAWAKLTTHHG